MKDCIIKIIIGFVILCIMIIGYKVWKVHSQSQYEIKVIGNSKWAFDIVFKNWNNNQKIKEFRHSIQTQNSPFVFLECGTTNGTSLNYYFVDFKKNQILADFRGIKGTFSINPVIAETIKEILKPIKKENQIFDGTSKMYDDATYFLTFHSKGQTLRYGFYSLSGYFGKYKNKEDERVSLINRIIFNKVLLEIEYEIWKQKPELFKSRPFFDCRVG